MLPSVKAWLNQVNHAVCVHARACVCVRPDQYELINRRRQLEGPWGWQIHTWCTDTHSCMHMHSPFLYSIHSFTLYLLSNHLQHLFLCLFVCFSDVFPHTTHLLTHISKRLFQQLHVTAFLSSLSFFSPFSCILFIRIIKGDFTSSISV